MSLIVVSHGHRRAPLSITSPCQEWTITLQSLLLARRCRSCDASRIYLLGKLRALRYGHVTSHHQKTNRISLHFAAWLIRARGQWFGLARFPWHRGETAPETEWVDWTSMQVSRVCPYVILTLILAPDLLRTVCSDFLWSTRCKIFSKFLYFSLFFEDVSTILIYIPKNYIYNIWHDIPYLHNSIPLSLEEKETSFIFYFF